MSEQMSRVAESIRTTPSSSPVVSVCLITYQHAPFIREALESVLCQEASFPFEICIGEDDSSDGTREICKEYARRFPDRIRLFLRSRSEVLFINGRPSGRLNLVRTLKECQGKYVALLEGDDYWTSPKKLQRQVDFLEEHQDVALCGHGVALVGKRSQDEEFIDPPQPSGLSCSTQELLGGMIIHTSTIMLRNWYDWDFPPWFFELPMGDWPLAIMCSLRGRIAFLPDTMSAYRLHGKGRWSGLDAIEQAFAIDQFYKVMLDYLGPSYRRDVRRHMYHTRAHREYLRQNLWRSRGYKYLSAIYGGPRRVIEEARRSLERVLGRLGEHRSG